MGTCLRFTLLACVTVSSAAARLPLSFEPDGNGGFVSRAGRLELQLRATGASLGSHSVNLLGANAGARAQGEELLPAKSHYLVGSDPRRWRTGVANYGRVRFREVYPGIDVVYYGAGSELEFDLVVAPGADPRRIELTCGGDFCEALHEPVIYQETAGKRRRIPGRFLRRGHRLAFAIGKWDHARPLVIDPVVSFASLIGGGDADSGTAVAVDGAGFIYVVGTTSSGNFPLAGAYQSSLSMYHSHVFVAKLNPGGTALVYSTYLGGSGDEFAGGIAVDTTGAAYVGGSTTSQDLPVTIDPADTAPGRRAFAVKFSPDGASLLYSTYVGTGGEGGGAIAVDRAGNAYITHGVSVSKLDTAGREAYSTSLGAAASRIAVDGAGNAYAAGSTSLATLPTKNAFQSSLAGYTNTFLAKLDDRGVVVYATYFGGGGDDTLSGLAVDAAGGAVVAGTTTSTNLPYTGAYQPGPSTPVAYKTSDGADSWQRSDAGLPSGAAFTIDVTNARNIYAVGGGRLFKSSDRGANWLPILREWSVSAFAVSPSAPTTLYASANNGQRTLATLRSSDGGVTWSTVSTQTFRVLAVDPKDPSTVYGGVGGLEDGDGVFKSTDGGETWNATSLAGPAHGVRSLVATPAALFAILGDGQGGGGVRVFVSRDAGENWAVLENVYLNSLVADPTNTSILYGLSFSLGILKSTDGGNTFSTLAGSPGASFLALAPSEPTTLYAATTAGLYKSSDSGAHWQAVTGLPVSRIVALAVDAGNPPGLYISTVGDSDGFVAKLAPSGAELAFATYLGGRGFDSIGALALGPDGSAYIAGSSSASDFPVRTPFRSALPSGGFVAKLSADGTSLLWSGFLGGASPAGISVAPGGGVYVTGGSSIATFPTANSLQPFTTTTSIYRSSDGGARWIGETPSGLSNVTALAVHPKTPSRVLAVGGGDLFLSTDAGASWNRVASDGGLSGVVFDPLNPSTVYAFGRFAWLSTNGGLTWAAGVFFSGSVRSVAIDPKNPTTLYNVQSSGVFKSTNQGTTWTNVLPGSFSIVRVDPQRTATVFAVSGSTIRKSTDSGANWSSSDAPGPILDLQIDPNAPSTIYAAAASGMLRSRDGGSTWSDINQGMRIPPGSGVATIMVDRNRDGTLYAAVTGGGVYRSSDRGDTWTRLSIEISKVQALAVDPTNSSRLYAGTLVNPSDAFVMRIEE